MELKEGIIAEKEIIVEEKYIASHLGSGGVPVYATPMMVLHMEETSRLAVIIYLNQAKPRWAPLLPSNTLLRLQRE